MKTNYSLFTVVLQNTCLHLGWRVKDTILCNRLARTAVGRLKWPVMVVLSKWYRAIGRWDIGCANALCSILREAPQLAQNIEDKTLYLVCFLNPACKKWEGRQDQDKKNRNSLKFHPQLQVPIVNIASPQIITTYPLYSLQILWAYL